MKNPITRTGDEDKVLSSIVGGLRHISTIGGTTEADQLRRRLDGLFVEAYCLLTGSKRNGREEVKLFLE